MTHAAPAPPIGREFDSFLFASIGDDRHGQPLSVLSALARSDVDPWQEAAELSRISRRAATARLTALISALPGEPIAALPLDAIARDLVARLPRANNFAPLLPSVLPAALRSENAQAGLAFGFLVVLIAIAVLMHDPWSPGPGPGAGPLASTTMRSMGPFSTFDRD